MTALIRELGRIKRLDARRRLSAFNEAFVATRGTDEAVQEVRRALADAAGVSLGGGMGLGDFMRELGGL